MEEVVRVVGIGVSLHGLSLCKYNSMSRLVPLADKNSSVFMGVAAYLIFGSWLNYNRYSARGWDLVPHSDTIRDLPYLFRDWIRRVVETVQGGGSRGGYSAV